VAFSLLSQGNPSLKAATDFFSLFYFGGLIILLFFKVFAPEEDSQLPYTQNMNRSHLLLVVLGVGGVLFLSTVFTRAFSQSVLYVPKTSVALVWDSALFTDIIFQILVASTETIMVIVGIKVFYPIFRKIELVQDFALYVAIGLGNGIWSVLHLIQAYASQPLFIIPAFLAGLIFVWLWLHSKSLLAPVLAHAFYNMLVLVLSAF